MQLAEYLMCVATRHQQAKEEHEDELKEQRSIEKSNGRRRFKMTYRDEPELLKAVSDSVRGKPSCLKKLSLQALVALAYLLKSKISNDPYTEGYEIIGNLVVDPERTIDYLNGFTELNDQEWIRFIETPGKGFTDNPPYCWLQSCIEFGDTFHKEMGVDKQACRAFSNNDAYLDAVMAYILTLLQDDSYNFKIRDPAIELASVQPDGWFRRIVLRVQCSSCELPAAEALKKYSLSVFQYLAMVGLFGMRDGDIRYDFDDPSDVARFFAIGRVCRKKMQEHIYGDKSQLKQHRLIEGAHGTFGESVRLTQLGFMALAGKSIGKQTAKEMKSRVKKNTLFDFEEPKVKKESLLLPAMVIEAIKSLLFSESRTGKRIRKKWHASLPAAWGSPTGTTVLLYGPPGTGKTLTAQYLASELKLPLLKIDAARVLSCWVGESEQNVRRIFDDYSNLQKEMGSTPVLLLNEADQLLGTREAGGNSVDKMHANMQNLFLEGLERFSGILVATTNRRDLLDEAFSRRFTYKLELPPPDKQLRIELWKSHLPIKRLAADVVIEQLADLGLTGGEIRLVIERTVRLMAYRGVTAIDNQTLVNISREELASRMKRYGNGNRIGFDTGNTS